MKKKLALALTAMLCLGMLASCSSDDTAADDAEEEEVATSKLAILDTAYTTEEYAFMINKDNEALLADVNDALATLEENGTLAAITAKYIEGVENDLVFQQDVAEDAPIFSMATNAAFPPYEYYENDTIVGIDAEIVAAIADELGMKLVIEDMEFESIIIAVQTGAVDIGAGGLTVTEERAQAINFTTSYATGVQVIIVQEGSAITTLDDLFEEGNDYKIGVQQNTTGDLYSTWDFEDAGLATIERYNKAADAVQALMLGQVDCVIIDNEPAKAFVETANN